jgi:hypothetical protein
VKTEDLIIELSRSLEPVQPLASPSVRLARWAILSLLIGGIGVLAIGARADVAEAVSEPSFAGLAMLVLATGIAAAGNALVLSVPGAERSPAQRGIPLLLFVGWAVSLTAMLVSSGEAIARLMALPVHMACIIEIAGFALIPGWALFRMLRRAAPLRRVWTAVLAALAATALGAVATQIVCPIDDPAHHLVGHLAPTAIFTVIGASARHRLLPPVIRL